jgi:protein O-mannosyl-transferase
MSGKQISLSNFVKSPFWQQWAFFTVLALLLYLPVINNSFVSDDFQVIRILVQDRRLNIDGFFRPLSDITIYLTYLVFGMNPAPYYLTGVLLHAMNAVLLFHFCIRWQWTTDNRMQQICAFFAALLFLTYPFHNESVAWILGRGVLMADTFGFIALLLLTVQAKRWYRMLGICACYFTGLAAYESIIMLPAMILIYVLMNKQERPYLVTWLFVLSATFLLHLAIRLSVSGSLTGDYGAGFFNSSVLFYIANLLKASGRMVLPPSDHPWLLMGLFCLVLACSLFITFRLWKQLRLNESARNFWIVQWYFLGLSMLLPMFAGVSTRTSESDRLLHFPSYFFCILVAFTVLHVLKRPQYRMWCFAFIIIYQVFFLEKNNLNWEKASNSVRQVLGIIAERKPDEKIFIANLPDEVDGAFIFRNGFNDALVLNQIDTASIVVASRLTRDEALLLSPVIIGQLQSDSVIIPPSFRVYKSATSVKWIAGKDGIRYLQIPAGSQIVYWNNKNWIRL